MEASRKTRIRTQKLTELQKSWKKPHIECPSLMAIFHTFCTLTKLWFESTFSLPPTIVFVPWHFRISKRTINLIKNWPMFANFSSFWVHQYCYKTKIVKELRKRVYLIRKFTLKLFCVLDFASKPIYLYKTLTSKLLPQTNKYI